MDYCEEYDDPFDDDDDLKWECAYPGECLMPDPVHTRDECHTVAEAEAYYAEMLIEENGSSCELHSRNRL